MVKINKIYTKTGDKGTTHLVGGVVVSKNSQRVKTYGELDELNAQIGIVIAQAELDNLITLVNILQNIQQRLFDLGAQLATPNNKQPQGIITINANDVTKLELQIDTACQDLPELLSFVLPGGCMINAQLHLARCICRRFERELVTLANEETVDALVLQYVNRLSDLLFALARRTSADLNTPEVLWDPKRSYTD